MINAANKNEQVWEHVQEGDVQAFEAIVRNYQNAVASVAFAGTGDVAGSEDIAQETFLVAWQSRDELREPSRLGGWLCGIARNLAKQWNRKRGAKKYATADDAQANLAIDKSPSAMQRVISAEEQRTVWNSLEKIPETYREVLVLFYRQSQSVAQVASSLEISEENVRQRLSRGRNLLRAEVARTVEQTLEHSQPGPQFTVAVMASLGSMSSFAKTASGAAAGSLAAKAVGSAVGSAAGKVAVGSAAAGVAGGLLGAAGGLGGAWLGTWVPAQMAPTMTERRMLEQTGKRIMRTSLWVTIGCLAGTACFFFQGFGVVGVVFQIVLWSYFTTVIIVRTIATNREVKRIRATIRPEDDPNPSWVREKFVRTVDDEPSRWIGRRATSSVSFLGWPLWDFQVNDPGYYQETRYRQPRHAKGWIAIGDRATGLLLAIGGRAVGFFAFGGISIGVISLGGASIGLALAIGGGALGFNAIGGGAVGYQSVGGLALGWNASGGCAIGVRNVFGGLAVSADRAAGGMAIARNEAISGPAVRQAENQTAVQEIIESVPLAKWMPGHPLPLRKPERNNSWIFSIGIVFLIFVISVGTQHLMYRKRRPGDPVNEG